MAKESILVVEDEADIQDLIVRTLTREGYPVQAAGTGEDARDMIKASPPSLVLLDLMLPGIDGLELCRILKRDSATEGIPIMMLTAKGEESDIVAGLELGADDYMTKPFSPNVLLARIRAVLRRGVKPPVQQNESTVSIHELEIHPGRREVRVEGNLVELTFTEFHVLLALASRPGWVFTRNQIVEAVRGDDYPVTERAVDVQIVGLRKKLGIVADYIDTVRGVGYRFKE